MSKIIPTNKTYCTGIDIGNHSIKVTSFSFKDKHLYLKSYFQEVEIPLKEDEDRIYQALEHCLEKIKDRKSIIYLSVSHKDALFSITTMPPMPKEDVKESVLLSAKDYFKNPVKELIVDVDVLGTVLDENKNEKQVVGVSSIPKKVIKPIASLFRRKKMDLALVVPSSLAFYQLISQIYLYKDDVVCALNIGYKESEIFIVEKESLQACFYRKIPFGGYSLSKSLGDKISTERGVFDLTFEEAEELKRQLDLGLDEFKGQKVGGIDYQDILSMIRNPLELLVNDIQRSVAYYQEKNKNVEINKIYLFGGGSLVKGLDHYLSRQLELDVCASNPVEDAKIERSEEVAESYAQFATSVGLVLSSDEGINLLPPEVKVLQKKMLIRLSFILVISVMIFGVVSGLISLETRTSKYLHEIGSSKIILKSYEPELRKIKHQQQAFSLLNQEPYWDEIFYKLSLLTPNNIHYTSISKDKEGMKIVGVIKDKENEEVFSNYLLTLQKELFNKVKLVQIKVIQGGNISQFELKCYEN